MGQEFVDQGENQRSLVADLWQRVVRLSLTKKLWLSCALATLAIALPTYYEWRWASALLVQQQRTVDLVGSANRQLQAWRQAGGPVSAAPQALQQALERLSAESLQEVQKADIKAALDMMAPLVQGAGHPDSAQQSRDKGFKRLTSALDLEHGTQIARLESLNAAHLRVLIVTALMLAGLALLAPLILADFRSRRGAEQQRGRVLDHEEELARLGCAETDLMSETVRWTKGMARLFGETGERVTWDLDWLYTRVPQAEREWVRSSIQAVRPDQPCEFQHRIVRSDGSLRTVLHRSIVVLAEDGWPSRSLTLLQDVTAQRDAERRIDMLVNSCPITGLFNRQALLERIDASLQRLRGQPGALLAVLSMQVEQFGMVMDSMGFEGGDVLLQRCAQRLTQAADSRNTLAHLGAGEFVCLIESPQVDAQVDDQESEAVKQAQVMRNACATPLIMGDGEVTLSCRAGLSVGGALEDTAQRLLQQAQAASRHEPKPGMGSISVYDPSLFARTMSRMDIEVGLRRALVQGGFSLSFQPQLELTHGRICGAEVLLRWTDPVRGMVSPVEFIPVAEESDLVLEIGEWVLRATCEQHAAWLREGLPPVRLAVNLSARQLRQADVAWRIQNVLRETGMDPRFLGIEVTESMFLDDIEHAARALTTLKSLGIEIALDDFGTGYSNLGYLQKLPIDVVKIDRSIVHDVVAAAHDVSMTRAVINMAHSLQMQVLAEGVETDGQLALLMAHHCDQIQGYIFSRPVPADEFATLLREQRRLPESMFQRERKKTLLLVDDESNIVASLRRLLRPDGYHIVTASSGEQGLQRLAEHEVDVIISDQRMPGMTGVEFLRRAKDLRPATVRMVLSGYTELQSVTDAINEGAIYKFLTKPWDDERLRSHVAEAFRQKGLADENQRLSDTVSTVNQELGSVNRRLQQLLNSQGERIVRESVSLQVLRELLESVPMPMVGTDLDGMIGYANEEAETLFAGGTSPLGRQVDEVLPADLVRLLQREDGSTSRVRLDGLDFRAICRDFPKHCGLSGSRGKLLVLTPITDEIVGVQP